jgi:hypothetical protein
MTNSINYPSPTDVIRILFEKLSEDHLLKTIDCPIRQATESFEIKRDSENEFIEIIGEFIRHIYQKGVMLKQDLTQQQAKSEAVMILEQGYQNLGSRGFDAAMLDTESMNPEQLETILMRIGEIIRFNQKEQYKKWIIAKYLNQLGWRKRCQIVETLLNQYQSYLPEDLRRSAPAEFADSIPELITTLMNADQVLKQTTTP